MGPWVLRCLASGGCVKPGPADSSPPTCACFSLPSSQMSPHCLLSRSCGCASSLEPCPLCGVRVRAASLCSLKTVVGCWACMTDSPISSCLLTLAFGALLLVLLLVFALMMLCDRRLCSVRDSQQQTAHRLRLAGWCAPHHSPPVVSPGRLCSGGHTVTGGPPWAAWATHVCCQHPWTCPTSEGTPVSPL